MTVCQRCVMDDSADSTIAFDDRGFCSYCTSALRLKSKTFFSNEEGEAKLTSMIEMLKREGQGKGYDCMMGLSGGLDSSYLAYLGAAKWGLRIIAVHIDDGYDTEISKGNLEKLVAATGIDYRVIKPNDVQFNALTLAYMKAGVPDLAVPQDNVLFATLFRYALEHDIKYFLSGSNFSTESILQEGCGWNTYDLINIRDIHRRFGTEPIDSLNFMSNWEKIRIAKTLKLTTLAPLNYVDYTREKAFAELHEYCGFEYYGRKHLENYLTAFLQTCWLPEKFGIDKRKSHLSSLIISGQMTRDEALEELGDPQYDKESMEATKHMMADNMGVDVDEIESLILAAPHKHEEYKTDNLYRWLFDFYQKVKNR